MKGLQIIRRIEEKCYPRSVLEECERATDTVAGGAIYRLFRLRGEPVAYSIIERENSQYYICDLAILPAYRRSRELWGDIKNWLYSVLNGAEYISADCRQTSARMAVRLLERAGYAVRQYDDYDYFPGEVVTIITAERK